MSFIRIIPKFLCNLFRNIILLYDLIINNINNIINKKRLKQVKTNTKIFSQFL